MSDSTAPSVPANVSTYLLTRNSVRVQWNASPDTGGSGIAGYKVYRGGTLISGTNPVSAYSFNDTGLSYKTTYSYTVKAVDNSSNESAASTATNVTTDRQLIFEDLFNRADSTNLGSNWGDYLGGSLKTVANRASAYPGGTSYTYYWLSAYNYSPGSFKATVRVVDEGSGAGIAFYKQFVSGNWAAYKAFLSNAYVYLTWDANLTDQNDGTQLASASVSSSTTISVETDTTTGSVKVYVNDVLKINTTIDTNAMVGPVGITGKTYNGGSYQYIATLDDFILEQN